MVSVLRKLLTIIEVPLLICFFIILIGGFRMINLILAWISGFSIGIAITLLVEIWLKHKSY